MLEFIIGLASGVLSGMGVGGGMILIPALTTLLNTEQHVAQSVNLFCFVPSSVIAVLIHIRDKNIEKRASLPMILWGVPFSVLGALLSVNMPSNILSLLFSAFIFGFGIKEIADSIKMNKFSKNADNNKRRWLTMQLTQKETQLMKDLKNQEQLCIDKYTRNAEQAKDPELKAVFTYFAKVEQGHLNTLTQIENGDAFFGSSDTAAAKPQITGTYKTAETDDKKNDKYLAFDLLTAEKHASHLYDTCVFEFKDEKIRNTLNNIQKDEQEHGKILYDYMEKNNMQN